MDSLDAVASRFTGLLEQFGAPYAVMGGLAVRLYALPRATFDVDFIAIVDREALPRLYGACESLGFAISEAQKAGWVDSVHGYPVVKFQWFVESRSIDVDVFLAETPFFHEVLQRRQRAGADGWETWFVTAEDLILLKLLAGRKKDQADVADILLVQGQLDEVHMRSWAAKLGIAQELETALRERSQ